LAELNAEPNGLQKLLIEWAVERLCGYGFSKVIVNNLTVTLSKCLIYISIYYY